MSESPKNINELIAALGRFSGKDLASDRELYEECRGVFEKLKRLSDFEPGDIKKTVEILEKLPGEIKELDIKELGIEGEDLESKSLNKEELKELIEDYEKAQEGKQKTKIGEEIYKRTGKKNVDQFVKTQKEIAIRNAEKLDKLSSELKEKVTQDIAKISEGQEEKAAKIIEEASLKEAFNKKELEKEIKKSVKEPEKVEQIIEKIEEVRAEIIVESKAEEIAQTAYEKLETENVPVSEKTKVEIKEEILKSWKESDELKIAAGSAGKERGEIIIRETAKLAEKFKMENLETMVNYRAGELGKEIGQDLRNNGVTDENLIEKYSSAVNKLTNNSKMARAEVNTSEVIDFVEGRHSEPGYKFATQPEIAVDEAQFMARNVVMAPKTFNRIIKNYSEARDLIGAEKLPKIKEVRVMEKMTALFKDNPAMLRLMNRSQKMVSFLETANAFPGSVLVKLGAKNAGLEVAGKIGGQAAGVFMKNAAAVIAEQGTLQGIKSIFLGLIGKGAVVVGGAGGGALTGAVVALQAIPVVGQIMAVMTAASIFLKPLIDKVKKWFKDTLNINIGAVGGFLSNTLGLGGLASGIGKLFFSAGTFLASIPTLLASINVTGTISTVIIFFFIGALIYSMFQQNSTSSLVPPTAIGMGENCVLKDTVSSGGAINCNQRAPENNFKGISKANFVRVANQWRSGKNYSEECYNDTVNRALCAGINPAYALWAWAHESGASNYSINNVEDFGIHGQPSAPVKDYNAQINYFLKLNPGKTCPNLEYWLSFATNYLTGGCDPDKKNANGQNGRDYLEIMQKTWDFISLEPMPSSINVPKGGQNCASSGNDPLEGPVTSEYTDENGQTWVCYGGGGGGTIPNFEPWDPSIPVPVGCPNGRPTSGHFSQGPFAPSCTHQNMSTPAVDIGTGDGTPIVATHPGVAVLNYDSVYGYYIDVHGKCEGKDFYTRYAHMPAGGFKVGNNSQVAAGQQIGVVDNTGASSGSHLHYHISGLNKNKFGQYLGLTLEQTEKLWGCCGENGKYCPP